MEKLYDELSSDSNSTVPTISPLAPLDVELDVVTAVPVPLDDVPELDPPLSAPVPKASISIPAFVGSLPIIFKDDQGLTTLWSVTHKRIRIALVKLPSFKSKYNLCPACDTNLNLKYVEHIEEKKDLSLYRCPVCSARLIENAASEIVWGKGAILCMAVLIIASVLKFVLPDEFRTYLFLTKVVAVTAIVFLYMKNNHKKRRWSLAD